MRKAPEAAAQGPFLGARSIQVVADYLGHTDPGFTLKVYAHLLEDSHERARLAVEAAWTDWVSGADGLATA
ncbi:hypothetical protein [Nocardia jejuensis]|uniref:hypothetical protein n=1 Tax=Nocardia jejuensis TaxID=328049 RepID=UPI000A82710C|nr:hypothetical protein [Nocardia jejuensis]